MTQFTLSNGWKVRKDDKKILLEVFPIEGTIFTKHYFVPLPLEIYKIIEGGILDAKILSQKHKLLSYAIKWEYSINKSNNFNEYILSENKGKFYIKYQSSLQGSETITKEISLDIYNEIKIGELTLKDIILKFKLNNNK